MRRLIFACAICLLPCAFACGPGGPKTDGVLVIRGRTMGTSYQVRIARENEKLDEQQLRGLIQGRLDALDLALSNWKPDSEISRFNASRSMRPFRFAYPPAGEIIGDALEIARLTGGAFDPTVGGLVELWGFGARKRKPDDGLPDAAAIRRVLKRTGYRRLRLNGASVRKNHPELTLNLSAIAKGYGADLVFEALKKAGHAAVMVEIGGEVRVGRPPAGRRNWRIGIEAPDYGRGGRRAYAVAYLNNRALATSGDYRNYFKVGERRFSHIIDPRTGHPSRAGVVSATIVGPKCGRADGLATALLVMDVRRGLRLIESLPGYEALLLVRDIEAKNGMREYRTSGMGRYLTAESQK